VEEEVRGDLRRSTGTVMQWQVAGRQQAGSSSVPRPVRTVQEASGMGKG
jgi:hypothetical protein